MDFGFSNVALSFSEELMIEILLKVPIKSIVCCTGVRKSWYKLITNPSFISLHLKKSTLENEKTHSLIRHCEGGKEYYSLHSDDETFAEYTKFKCGFPCSGGYFRVTGICNGLICLSDDQTKIITLWNPMIKKAVHLPKPKILSNVHSLGFGFDSITNDYKVVRISYRRMFTGSTQLITYVERQIELYNLNSGTWRFIDDNELAMPLVIGISKPFTLQRQDSPVVMNGSIHWTAYTERKYSIVSFNMHLETFKEIPLPKTLADVDVTIRALTIWECKKTLCVVEHLHNRELQPRFCIWTMKEYGVVESWTKLFDIDTQWIENLRFQRLLGFRKNGEVLFDDGDNRLKCYLHEGMPKVKDLKICSSRGLKNRGSLYVDYYTESLVFLDKGASCSYKEW